jgi:beta-galactosidase
MSGHENSPLSTRFQFVCVALVTLLLFVPCESAFGLQIDGAQRKYNLNADWRFIRDDVEGAQATDFDASQWTTISCPHTWNDIDTFDDFGTGGHQGESDLWQGAAWYRKEFTLPAGSEKKNVYIEFEGVRQVADVYLNGHHLGQDKTGFIPFAFDLTPHLNQSGKNVLAVRADNTVEPKLYSGKMPWHHQNWHPPHGGIYRNVYLHVLDPVHVTLPIYANLETEGIYAWTESLSKEKATIGLTAEIANLQEQAADATVKFSLLDDSGEVVVTSEASSHIAAEEKAKVASTLDVADPHLWEPNYPYVYRVQAEVMVDGKVRDVSTTPFGFRNFRFDKDTGFWINGHPQKLHGWGQKPIGGWAGLGAGYPNWMHDYTLKMMEEAGGNMIRWGHSAGPAVGVESSDKYGFVTIMPGVDGEKDCQGEAWETRTNAFRDTIIYYRNHPTVCIWEGGNYNVSPEHAAELKQITETWDPQGGRYFGHRMSTPAMLDSVDVELGTVGRARALPMLGVIETEYDRTETPRRVWDKFSPPDFGNLGKLAELNTYHLAQEGFATNAIKEWWTLFGAKPEHSGGANWIFSDGTHGTRQRTDCARATGEVDGVRLPKEAYWALQATWDDEDRVHLIGHWTYPADTVKPMYAVAKADRAELFVNGKSLGDGQRSLNTLFTWPDVAFETGEIKVVAYRDGAELASQVKQTAGVPAAIRLTPTVSPAGWLADGADVALVDFEVVDAEGRRCPTDQARVDFEVSGPGIWRGGYNSGTEDSINHLYLDTECGINRVSIRSTLEAGQVILTARREGLEPATVKLSSKPIELTGGIQTAMPVVYETTLPERPEIDAGKLTELTKLRNTPIVKRIETDESDRMFSMFAYTGTGPGGMEDPWQHEMLAYSDDARINIAEVPDYLKDSRVIRTALGDHAYWAADYIVATAGQDLDLYVAHDPKVPLPEWLEDYQKTGDVVKLNRGKMQLYTKRLAKDEGLRIPGNADQGKAKKRSWNIILFSKPVSEND